MTVIFIVFFIFVVIFTKRCVDEVRNQSDSSTMYQKNAKNFFRAEAKYLKRMVILAIIASLAILILKKTVVVFALALLHIFSLYILYRMIKSSQENIDGKNERFAARLFTAEKLMIICTVVYGLANLVC